jgi:hypothetical protein
MYNTSRVHKSVLDAQTYIIIYNKLYLNRMFTFGFIETII